MGEGRPVLWCQDLGYYSSWALNCLLCPAHPSQEIQEDRMNQGSHQGPGLSDIISEKVLASAFPAYVHCHICQSRGSWISLRQHWCIGMNWTQPCHCLCLCPGLGLASLLDWQPGPESHCSTGILTSFLSLHSFHCHHVPSRYTAKGHFSISQTYKLKFRAKK